MSFTDKELSTVLLVYQYDYHFINSYFHYQSFITLIDSLNNYDCHVTTMNDKTIHYSFDKLYHYGFNMMIHLNVNLPICYYYSSLSLSRLLSQYTYQSMIFIIFKFQTQSY